jgi:hypothetical protein
MTRTMLVSRMRMDRAGLTSIRSYICAELPTSLHWRLATKARSRQLHPDLGGPAAGCTDGCVATFRHSSRGTGDHASHL